MLDFQPLKREKIEEYKTYYDYTDALGCERNFVNGYLWNEEYRLRVAVFDGTLIKAYFRDEKRVWGYCMPSGRNVAGAVNAVFEDAKERGQTVFFAYMTKQERDELDSLFPNHFTFRRETANQDYIYTSRDLATLAGKKYHSKRNHISKFYRTYADRTCFKTLDKSNLADAMEVMKLWCAENDIDYHKHGEYAVFKKACEEFEELNMQGAVLYVDGKPAAMTMGSEISPKCFDVIFEKALREYDGIYAVINNEFAKTLTRYEYINREEDMDIEGLRKSKLSYHPAIILDRYNATPVL